MKLIKVDLNPAMAKKRRIGVEGEMVGKSHGQLPKWLLKFTY